MEIRYQCGNASSVWKVDMQYHKGGRRILSHTLETNIKVKKPKIIYEDEKVQRKIRRRYAVLVFAKPVMGTLTAILKMDGVQ